MFLTGSGDEGYGRKRRERRSARGVGFSAGAGRALPRDIHKVTSRHKDIVCSSRTRHNTDICKRMNNLKVSDFSATSMREHWMSGLEDTRRALKRRDGLAMPPEGMGIVVHDVHRELDY